MHAKQLRLFAEIEDRHWWFAARRQIVQDIVRQIMPPENGSILDIGCGTGGNIGMLAHQFACTGIDTSPDAIEFARQRFPKIPFVCGSVASGVATLAAKAKLILMMDVIEHVQDDFGFFANVVAAASPGTCLLLTVPADMSLWSTHDETVLHYRRYDRIRLEALWSGLPVKVRLLSYFNSRLYPLIRLARFKNRIFGRSWGTEGTDFAMPSRTVNSWLRSIFAGEASKLVRAIDHPDARTYSFGVSLIGVLQRKAETSCHEVGRTMSY